MTVASQHAEPTITQIGLTEEERISGVPKPATIEKALEALHLDGIVVFNNAVDVSHLDILNERMSSDLLDMLEKKQIYERPPAGTGNYLQWPPLYPQYAFEDVFANRIAGAVLSNILGPDPELRNISSNSTLNGTARQPVHCDMLHEHLDFPFCMTVNIPLIDMSMKNGATEFWLGTHLRENKGIKDPVLDGPWIASEYLEKRRAECPPIRPAISKGSLLIRDMRLWHAGVANETSTPRILLATTHFAKWYRNPMRFQLPESSRNKWEKFNKDIQVMADYIPDAEYDPLTMKVQLSVSGGNREPTPQELLYNAKYGNIVQKLDDMY